jgi:hypothetical protein
MNPILAGGYEKPTGKPVLILIFILVPGILYPRPRLFVDIYEILIVEMNRRKPFFDHQ